MTNSKGQSSGMAFVERVLDNLRPERLQGRIDGPLQRAVSTFRLPTSEGNPARDLLECGGRFLAHLYRHGTHPPIMLDADAARGAALNFLQTYASEAGRGYNAALAEVIDRPAEGLEAVLLHLHHCVLGKETSKHRRSAIARRIIPLDWSARKTIASAVREYLGSHAPPSFACLPPELLAGELEALLMTAVQIEHDVRSQLGAGRVVGPSVDCGDPPGGNHVGS